jgi:hypothetical protein
MATQKRTVLKRWKNHLEEVAQEVTFLNHYNQIRTQFNLIAGRSPVAEKSSAFWEFTHRAFAHELIIRICRLSEKQSSRKKGKRLIDEVYALRALLGEFAENHKYLSREHYLGISPVTSEEYFKKHPSRFDPPDTFMYDRLNREFDEIAGAGASCISQQTVLLDIAMLDKVTKRLKAYRHKRLAHNSVKKGRFKIVKFSEIPKAISAIDKFMRKYYLLFHCASHTLNFHEPNLTPLFRQAWISNQKDADKILAKFKEMTGSKNPAKK